MEELDKRYKKKLERSNSITPSKSRVVGRVAVSLPPRNHPKWAIDDQWEPPDSPAEPSCGTLLPFQIHHCS